MMAGDRTCAMFCGSKAHHRRTRRRRSIFRLLFCWMQQFLIIFLFSPSIFLSPGAFSSLLFLAVMNDPHISPWIVLPFIFHRVRLFVGVVAGVVVVVSVCLDGRLPLHHHHLHLILILHVAEAESSEYSSRQSELFMHETNWYVVNVMRWSRLIDRMQLNWIGSLQMNKEMMEVMWWLYGDWSSWVWSLVWWPYQCGKVAQE